MSRVDVEREVVLDATPSQAATCRMGAQAEVRLLG